MDAANILVVVLTSAAVGWLIWVEIHSRRNRTDEPAREALESAAANENGTAPQSRRTPARDKTRRRTA
jgi:hypothetical protein